MGRKKWEKSQMWKKVISGTVSLALFLSFFPMEQTSAYNATAKGSLKELREWVESYQKDIQESSIGVNPIKEGVDVTTEEEQNIIVEFKALPNITAKTLKDVNSKSYKGDEAEKNHSDFNKFLESKEKEKGGFTYIIEHSYFETFNGVAMTIKGIEIPELLESGVISKIWLDEEVRVDPIKTNIKDANQLEGRMATSSPLINVDKLHAENIKGKGIKVGVIDTGIDYNHPDLKSNYKGGYDAVDKDNDPMETTYEDWKKSDKEFPWEVYVTSHGTHVAGTIAGTGENTSSEHATTGLAPEVDLYGYRVLGPTGMGQSSDIIAGIEKSVEDKMDVINLSLGADTTNTLYPTAIACNNAALAGVVPVVANGNSGPGEGTMGAPATSPLSISVGASTTDIALPTFDIKLSEGNIINSMLLLGKMNSFDNLEGKELEIVYGGLGNADELDKLNVEGKILFVDRGEIPLVDKFNNAMAKGAAALILANNVDGEINMYLGEPSGVIPGLALSKEEGLLVKKALGIEVNEEVKDVENGESIEAANESITVQINKVGVEKLPADKLADFSSRGPASDGMIKPDIVAPGVGILSSYPFFITNPENPDDYSEAYSRIDGTSMAAPHIAGVAALMLQNNNNLTPDQIKVNMMNTAEKMAEDYPINAVGAGRVNAYEAVHTEIDIRVLDKTITLDEMDDKKELDYITGSLSFDRVAKTGKDTGKEIPMEILNNGNEAKTFSVKVEYLGENVGANNAMQNGVSLDIPKEISVSADGKTDLTPRINISANAEVGVYEGFIILTNINNETEDYRIPFSVKYLNPGIETIEYSRTAISNDLEMMHFLKGLGIDAYLTISSPIENLEIYVQDYNTKERIGFVGIEDISYWPAGYTDKVSVLGGRAAYFPMDKNGEIEYIRRSLTDGKYTLEIIANDLDNDNQYVNTLNFLVDNEDVDMTMELEGGIYEVSDDMYTEEEEFGEMHNAFWLKGNVSDNSTVLLQEMGYDVDSSDIVLTGFVNGMPRVQPPVDANGNFKIGIEKADLQNGIYEVSPMPTDIATSQNLFLPPRYFLIEAGSPYHGVELDKKSMVKGENITATIKAIRVEGSTFKATLDYANSFEVVEVRPSKGLQEILDDNGYKAVIKKVVSGEASKNLELEVSILDKEGKNVDISGDIDLLDVEFNLVSDSECEFYKEYFQSRTMEIKNSKNEVVKNFYAGFYEGVDIKLENSSLKTFPVAQGEYETVGDPNHDYGLDKYYWIEDSKGNKYEVFFHDQSQEYRAYNVPITDEELTLVSALPGHFRKVAKFVPSRIINDELLGKVYYVLGSEYYSEVLGGDINGDGLIDILDAIEIEKHYGQKVDYNTNSADINFDGIVDAYDMDYVVYNFAMENEQVVGRGKPLKEHNGRTMEDVLKECGYTDEIRLEGMDIDKPYLELEVGESDKITAVIKPGSVPGIGLVWSSDNEKVVTVDEDGNVTAISPGTANVIVETTDGRLKLSTSVNVFENGEVPEIDNISVENPTREVYVGDEFEFNFKVEPYESLVNNVSYVSSSNSIVSIKDGKGVANKSGKAFVTASINYGMSYITWEVSVVEKEVPVINLESIKLNKNKLNLNKDEEEQLKVTFKPEDATNKEVTWKSSNDKVAKVIDGNVVAVGKGEATITVTSVDGNLTDTCKVKVKEKDTGKPDVELPQTGAAAGASMAMALGVIAVAAGLSVNKKRKNEK